MEKKRNNRLQFALSTLVLAVLLLASAAMTWWNCEPWRPAFAIPISFAEECISFSNDDRYIYSFDNSFYKSLDDDSLKTRLYNAQTGELLHAWTNSGHLVAAADWNCENGYFYIVGRSGPKFPELSNRLCGLWRINTGEDLLKTHPALANVQFLGLLGDGQFALIKDNSAANLHIVRFPSLETLCDTGIRSPNPQSLSVAPDKDQVALACGTKITLFSLSKAKALRTLDAEGCAAEILFSPDSRKLAYRSIGANVRDYQSIRVIDLENSSLVKSFTFGLDNLFVVKSFTSDTWHIHFTADSSRLIYSHPAPLQLLLYDFKMDSTTVLQEHLSADSTKLAGDTLYSMPGQKAWDVRTAKLLYQNTNPNAAGRDTAHDRYILVSEYGKFNQSLRIVDIQSNESTGTLRAARWPKQFHDGIKHIYFAHHSDDFITTPCDMSPDGHPAATDVYTIWHRGVPNRWWGFTTMPECWLTLALAIVFVWNICRRRRSPS